MIYFPLEQAHNHPDIVIKEGRNNGLYESDHFYTVVFYILQLVVSALELL